MGTFCRRNESHIGKITLATLDLGIISALGKSAPGAIFYLGFWYLHGLARKNSVVWSTDRHGMANSVDWEVKIQSIN